MLTPTLALTATAAATAAHWELRYWDESLLQGPPPLDPFPEVVGITVHLTFAARAYELARWYRQWGAKVVLGGLHVPTAPGEAARHADALAIGEGVQLWPQILQDVEAGRLQPVYRGDFGTPYRDDPMPRRDLLQRDAFLTTSSVIATRGCHNRCGFCYLSTKGLHMPYRLRDVEQIVEEIRAEGQPYACSIHRQQPRVAAGLPARALPGAGRLHRCLHRLRIARARQPRGRAQTDARAGRLCAPGRHPARIRHPGERQLRARLRSRPSRRFRKDHRLDRGQPPRVRDVPYPDAVSRDDPFQAARSAEPDRASRLALVRYRARRLRARADDGGTALRGLRMVLPAAVLAPLDLAPSAPGSARRAAVPCDVLPL